MLITAASLQFTLASVFTAPGYAVTGCIGHLESAVPEAVVTALARVRSCLSLRERLNPATATLIDLLARRNRLTISCVMSDLRGKANTVHEGGGRVRIYVDAIEYSQDRFRPLPADSADTKKKKRTALVDNLTELLFHEFFHGVDPQGRLTNGTAIHNVGLGVPDPIYGCQLACFPGDKNRPVAAYKNAERKLVIPRLAEDRTFKCPYSSFFYLSSCRIIRSYANLCRTGRTVPLRAK